MKVKRLLVGVKLAPVLSRKDVFEADIGPFVNDGAKTSMHAQKRAFFISYISREYDSPWYIQI